MVRTFGTAFPLDSFDRIAGLSFVTTADDGFLSLHNVVAEAIRETLSEEMRQTSLAALFEHFSSRVKVAWHREITTANVTALFEAAYLRQAQGLHGYAEWLSEATEPLRVAAQYAPLTTLWRDTSIAIEKALGAEHADTAVSLNNLAYLLKAQGDYVGAQPLYERALAIREKTLGAEHPDTAQSLNNLARLLQAQGDYARTRPLYERALAICEKALGPEHPLTALSLNNSRPASLRATMPGRGRFTSGRWRSTRRRWGRNIPTRPEPQQPRLLLQARATAPGRGRFGARPGHPRRRSVPSIPTPRRASTTSPCCFRIQADFAAARPLYERALAIREKVLGPDHPETATSLNNLATLLQARATSPAPGRFRAGAGDLEKALGARASHTAMSLDNLGLCLRPGAIAPTHGRSYERALAICEKALGPDHPDTATIRNNLANLLSQARSFGPGAEYNN